MLDLHGNRVAYDIGKTPQQYEFVMSEAEFPAYFGGFNNGKTFSAALRAWLYSLAYPNNRGVIGRRLLKDLRATTQHEFFKIVGCNSTTIRDHPMVDHWDKSNDYLRLKNGSEIYFLHLEDENALASILSLSLRWFALDQAEEIPEAAFLVLISRIGRTDTNLATGEKLCPPWGAVVGNPAGHNWIWKRWKKDGGLGPEYHLIEASTYDFHGASESYKRRLEQNYDSYMLQRYVHGSWDVFKGQVYDEFDERLHVIEPFAVPDPWKAGIGLDLGYNHPTAAVWMAVDYAGNWYVYNDYRARERIPAEHAPHLRSRGLTNRAGQILPVYAPHDAKNRNPATGTNLQQEYADQGIPFITGTRVPELVGIQRVKKKLKVDMSRPHPHNAGVTGAPQLFVMRNCEALIEEMGTYAWKELRPGQEEKIAQPDEVVKVNDDTVDSLRTWAMGFTSRTVPEEPRRVTVEGEDIAAITRHTLEHWEEYMAEQVAYH